MAVFVLFFCFHYYFFFFFFCKTFGKRLFLITLQPPIK